MHVQTTIKCLCTYNNGAKALFLFECSVYIETWKSSHTTRFLGFNDCDMTKTSHGGFICAPLQQTMRPSRKHPYDGSHMIFMLFCHAWLVFIESTKYQRIIGSPIKKTYSWNSNTYIYKIWRHGKQLNVLNGMTRMMLWWC